jgi:hypothetical protein
MSSRAENGLTLVSLVSPVSGGVACAGESSCEDEDPATMGSIVAEAPSIALTLRCSQGLG